MRRTSATRGEVVRALLSKLTCSVRHALDSRAGLLVLILLLLLLIVAHLNFCQLQRMQQWIVSTLALRIRQQIVE